MDIISCIKNVIYISAIIIKFFYIIIKIYVVLFRNNNTKTKYLKLLFGEKTSMLSLEMESML